MPPALWLSNREGIRTRVLQKKQKNNNFYLDVFYFIKKFIMRESNKKIKYFVKINKKDIVQTVEGTRLRALNIFPKKKIEVWRNRNLTHYLFDIY
jgi:hypothetical protein